MIQPRHQEMTAAMLVLIMHRLEILLQRNFEQRHYIWKRMIKEELCMNLMKCKKSHFYDGDKFASCPHCNTQDSESVTVFLNPGDQTGTTAVLRPGNNSEPVTVAGTENSESVTVARKAIDEPVTQKDDGEKAGDVSFQEAMQKIKGTTPMPLADDKEITMSYYNQKITNPVLSEPVVGWLVCTKGNFFGRSFNLKSGRNFIGRGAQMDVSLEDEESVSRDRHAVVVYEPMGRIFLAQAGDARELFYVNDSVVLDNVQLKPYDTISIGKVDLRFIPCCTSEFAWEDIGKEADRKEKKEATQ